MKRRGATSRAQRGAAILMAMLTVTLVATFAAAALWQQWRAVEVEGAERSRVQSSWVLTGALDWARLILREDGRSGGADHLAEPWALPLQEARLSTFLAADSNNTTESDSEDAFLSGEVTDIQSRLNVMALVSNNQVNPSGLRAFSKLFDALGLPQAQLQALAENLRLAADTGASANAGSGALLMPQRMEQLAWLGLAPQTIAALTPYAAILPAATPVNLNTASAEVIFASVADLDMAEAQRLVAQRERQHFRTLAEAGQLIPEIAGQINDGGH
ncbi:MAG: type II secretion system minor pseudopilin GspK, partial [Burkholderiaceae bacterium]